MATVVAGTNIALRLDQLDIANLVDGTFTTRTTSTAVIDIGGGYIETFTGVGFTYDAFGDPNGGTITGIQERLNGTTTFQVTGLNTSVVQFVDWALAGANATAFASMFSGNDNIIGSSQNDLFLGYGGHDNLFGGAGADAMSGGDGNDHIYGQSPNGGPDEGDYIEGNGGSDYIQGNAGDDILDGGDGSDRIQGGQGNDSLIGGTGNDTVNGNLGNDSIDGGSDNDSLRGGQGNDSIAGGSGNDVISGDLGTDTLSGGSGIDLFQFSGAGSSTSAPDRITDFTDGQDRIALGLLPASVLTGAAQASLSAASTFAQQLFNGNAGTSEVAAIAVGSDTYVFYSSNGGATVDSAIQLVGINPSIVTTSDFI
jgi:serralysin